MSIGQSWRGVHVWTVGHSTRSLDALVELLRAFDVTVLADIRSIPKSRHNPQFNGDVNEDKILSMSSKQAMRLLAERKGIGPWSAGLVLLRGMGRLDVFPEGDVGAARGLSTLMRLEPGPTLDRIVQRFGTHRGYLYFCSLGGSLLARGLIHAAPLPL